MREFIEGLIDFLKKFLSRLEEPRLEESRNSFFLKAAAEHIGVKEWKDGSNPQVEKYLDWGSRADNKDSGLDDSIPWCAGYIGERLESVNMGSTNSLAARSYLGWGKSSKNNPVPGDLVVYWRGSRDGWQGHVGVYLMQTDTHIYTLGGNQNDEVNVTSYSKDRFLDFRRSSKEFDLNSGQIAYLTSLAKKILDGEPINSAGSVV
jgi:uncharacterized protein (TIGR02594 family)